MDPIIKRVVVDPAVPLPPASVRAFGVLGLGAFLAAVAYAKFVTPGRMQEEVYRDMSRRQAAAAAGAAGGKEH